jgi:hypothetical protein
MILPNLIAPPSGHGSAPPDPAFDYLARVAADGGTVQSANGVIQNVNKFKIPNSMGSNLFDSASIVIDANGGIKTGKAYALKPANGAADLDWVRNSPVFLEGQNGVLIERAANVPAVRWSVTRQRWEIYPTVGRTNLFRNSEPSTDPGQGTRTGISFAANDWGIGLSGKVVFGDNSINRLYYDTDSLASSTAYSAAFIIKTLDGNPPVIRQGGQTGGTFIFRFSASWGAGIQVFSEPLEIGSGLYFITVIGSTVDDSAANGISKRTAENSQQFEASAIMIVEGNVRLTLSDYIRTTGTIQSKAADVCSKTGLADYIGQTEGTIYAELNASGLPKSGNRIITLSDGTESNRISIGMNSANTFEAQIVQGGVGQTSITSGAIPSGLVKIALAYAENNVVFYINGVQIGIDTSVAVPATSVFNLGSNAAGGAQFNDAIGPMVISKQRLSNSELQAATTI